MLRIGRCPYFLIFYFPPPQRPRPARGRAEGQGFAGAPFGIIGLETLAPLCVTELVLKKVITKKRLSQLLCSNPARLLGLGKKGRLAPGFDADISILDPLRLKKVPGTFASRSSNSPFKDRPLRGWPTATIAAGKVVFRAA